MMHPLHTKEFLEMLKASGCKHTDRRTGQSTAIALETIARAIQQPHKKVRIVDHHPTVDANRFLANTIASVIGRLGLEHLHVNQAEMTLVFERRTKP